MACIVADLVAGELDQAHERIGDRSSIQFKYLTEAVQPLFAPRLAGPGRNR